MRPGHRTLLGAAATAVLVTLAASGAAVAADSTAPFATGPAPTTGPAGPAPVTGADTGSDDGAAVPTLTWAPCPTAPDGQASTVGFECATAAVPVDHGDPGGDTFELAVIKHAATGDGPKVGTVFWNPGGPSDAGTEYLPVALDGFPDEVRQRFDIISWDPRGMGGGTTPVVQCFDSEAQEGAFLAGGPQSLPVTDEELAAFVQFRRQFSEHCTDTAGELLSHVSTADNARDLDLLRRAVGEDQISYYGTSYGTFLGATYVNMFPDSVRNAVLDGAVFPTAWAEPDGDDPDLTTFLRVGSDEGGVATLAELFRQCGLVDATRCAFSAGSAEATTEKWSDLLAKVERSPVTLDGQTLTAADLLSFVQSSIYIIEPVPGFGRFPGWAAVAETIQQVWDAAGSSTTTTSTTSAAPEATAGTTAVPAPDTTSPTGPSVYTTSGGRQLSVICGESPNPTTDAAYVAQAKSSYERVGLTAWPWVAACTGWSAEAADPYLGPWDTYRAPVLVIGNTFDPATPYTSSQRMAEELADGRLLTVDGFGHTQLLNRSACAQELVAAYLVDGTLPPEGTRCAQDGSPFPAQP